MVTTIIAPVSISLVGRKNTMCVGALLQTTLLFTYINPTPALYYTFSGVAGLGASLLWIGVVRHIKLYLYLPDHQAYNTE